VLSGDLDAIVLMALRKEPQRRYASAEHLAEDVRRYLEGQPVVARRGTVQYRVGKFIRRHRVGVAAALVVAAALITSTAVTYRAMQHTRRMFEDLRQFDKFVVNDLDAMLRRGGATPARQAVLAKAVESLDRLAGESKGDPGLQSDLITAYIKMGDVQGNFFVPNLGEKNVAEESYRKAVTMAETLWRTHPAEAAGKQQAADVRLKLGDVLANRQEALEQYAKSREVYESMPADRAVSGGLMRSWDKTGATQGQLGDAAGAVESYRRALRYAQELKRREAVEMLNQRIAYFSALSGDPAGAEETMLAAVHAYESGPNANPRNLAVALRVLAEVQRRAGKLDAALADIERSLKITTELLADDPQDKRSQIDHEQGLVAKVELLSARGRKAEEREVTASALRLLKQWVERGDAADYQIQDYVKLLLHTPFAEFQDNGAALQYAQKLAAMTREADPGALDLLARAYDRVGERARAIETERKAIGLLPHAAGPRPSELRSTLETNLQAFQSRAAGK
jgi:tetratricopeptide (TPR) repeat protein